MATNIQNASGIMDALADWRGMAPVSAARKIEIAEKIADFIAVTPPPETNDEKADAFLRYLFQQVRNPLRQRAERLEEAGNQAGVTQAGDDEVADL